MKLLRELWALLDAHGRRRFLALQGLSIVMAFSTIAGAASLAPLLMVLSDAAIIERNATLAWLYHHLGFASHEGFLAALGGTFVVAMLVASLLNLLGTSAITRFSLDVADEWHTALFDEYLRRDPAFHAAAGADSLFNRVVYATNRVATGMLEGAMLLISNAFTVTLILVSVLFVDALIAGTALVWIGGSYLLIYWLARRRLYRNGEIEARLIEDRVRFAREPLAAIGEVQVAGAQPHFQRGFARACRGISRVVANNHAIAQLPRYALECMTVCGLVVAALVVSHGSRVSEWLPKLTFLGFAAYRLLPAIQGLFAAVVRMRANTALFADIRDDLAVALVHARNRARTSASRTPTNTQLRHELRFEDVSLRYAPQADPALAGISVSIPAGALVGIVGANGSGKSSLLAVALALLEPTEGRVFIDDHEIDFRDAGAWHRQLAYVPQRIAVFDDTVAGNIALGIDAESIDRARLERALQLARLDSWVRSLPAGLDTRVGSGRAALSGGQRQRLAIARALYRDAAVLVMDESTSALDGVSEKELIDILRELRGTRTILLVAHRPAVIRACEWLMLLERGALVASGDYASLVRESALFRGLAGVEGPARTAAAGH